MYAEQARTCRCLACDITSPRLMSLPSSASLTYFNLQPQARVEAAGGEVMWWNGERVMGVLAVSRSIGDHYLRPFVIAQPEVRSFCWTPSLSETCLLF